MGRSQRHKVLIQSASAVGSVFEQGVVGPAALLDTGTYTAPVGPPGGPLQGSTIAGPAPAGVLIPTITTLSPNTAVVGAAALTMTVNGTNFTKGSRIFFNGGEEPTTFISDVALSTIVKPATVSIAGAYPVTVINASVQESNAVNFTFTATGLQERSYPMAAIAIASVEDDEDGLALTLPKGSDVREGDTVTIEATGSSDVNGSYTVVSVEGTRVVVDNQFELASPITSKGRVIVTEGA